MKNYEKLDEKRNNLSFLVELCCFPVQCLEECWHNNVFGSCFRTLAVILVSIFIYFFLQEARSQTNLISALYFVGLLFHAVCFGSAILAWRHLAKVNNSLSFSFLFPRQLNLVRFAFFLRQGLCFQLPALYRCFSTSRPNLKVVCVSNQFIDQTR